MYKSSCFLCLACIEQALFGDLGREEDVDNCADFLLMGSMLPLIRTEIIQQYKVCCSFVVLEFMCALVCMTKPSNALL